MVETLVDVDGPTDPVGTVFTEVESFYEIKCKVFRNTVVLVYKRISYLCCGLIYSRILGNNSRE